MIQSVLTRFRTWQDGVSEVHTSAYTNIIRLARMVDHHDERHQPQIPQIVYYQAGIGSSKNMYSEYVEGTTGDSISGKVEDAYAFIAHNFVPGDEVFLFGFSRGAYTARMVAKVIGDFGILDRRDMGEFATIYKAQLQLAQAKDSKEVAGLQAQLKPWTQPGSLGRVRAGSDNGGFSIKVVGVFDTVGTFGLPEEFIFGNKTGASKFGFPDKVLGEHIERAYQALALDEPRADFVCTKFEQSANGRKKGQILRQVWFNGCHSDIGGGYKEHDLSDLTLTWMAANIIDVLCVDPHYLNRLLHPVKPWGQLPSHDPLTGVFKLSRRAQRPIPTNWDEATQEMYHASVLEQPQQHANLNVNTILAQHPDLVAQLSPLEQGIKALWPSKLNQPPASGGHGSLSAHLASVSLNPHVQHLSSFLSSHLKK
ncbi:hypothetical protein BDN72DRAFT_807618 [Pluteus cervinus]|uniref:Uncharacterized protein n=1 Tax=Pluteus cervinus TaxID=181527 RepID=A0ACD3BG09_9AGAR|nr:hypothetical protein BDN72DRAFT_807618 [Pluteus cervinus]